MPNPVLICTEGALKGRRFDPPAGGLDIGRAEENHVVIGDDGVSRFHARVLYDNGSLWLQDAGSRNGIFVNGNRLTGHRALKVGDTITIAQHVFEVRWDDEVEDPTSEDASDPKKGRWFWPFS